MIAGRRMYQAGGTLRLIGRWLAPDPVAGDISNPQSLNRYAYVLNNPTILTDPLGLCSAYDCSYTDANGNYVFHADAGPCPPWVNPFFVEFGCGFFGVCQTSGTSAAWWSPRPPGGSTPPAEPPAPKQQPQPCGDRGLGVGVSYGGNGDLGAGFFGGTATGSVGAGLFYDTETGPSAGAFAGGGAAAYATFLNAGVPQQAGQPLSWGPYAGGRPKRVCNERPLSSAV